MKTGNTLKILGLVSLGLLLAAIVYVALNRGQMNQAVMDEMYLAPQGARAAKTMILTLPDGSVYPVNYLVETAGSGQQAFDRVYVGIDGWWWREFLDQGSPVEMWIQGQIYRGHGRVVLDDPAHVDAVFSRLRPTVPDWLPAWLNGKLVVITLHQDSTILRSIEHE